MDDVDVHRRIDSRASSFSGSHESTVAAAQNGITQFTTVHVISELSTASGKSVRRCESGRDNTTPRLRNNRSARPHRGRVPPSPVRVRSK